jgi:hypothetical protein
MTTASIDPVDEVLDRRRPNFKHLQDIDLLLRTDVAGGWTDLAKTLRLLGDQNDARGRMVRQLKAEIKQLSATAAAPHVWWLQCDYADPEVFRTQDAARADAIRNYREANDLTDGMLGWLGEELPDFAWRAHRDGGIELFVDARATGLIVRQLTVKDAAAAVTTHG